MAESTIVSSSSFEVEDENCTKIVCTSLFYVQQICQNVSEKFNTLIDSYELSEELKSEVKEKFCQTFKNTVFQNITIKGLPCEVDKDASLSTLNKEQKRHLLNQTIVPKLGREMVRTTEKRKKYPVQCCRVLKQRLKHERQNLKKQKVNVSFEHSVSPGSDDKSYKEQAEKLSSSFSRTEEFLFQQKNTHLEVLKCIGQIKKAKADVVNALKICSNQTELDGDKGRITNVYNLLPQKVSNRPSVL